VLTYENPSEPDLLGLPLDQVSTSQHEKRDDDSSEFHRDIYWIVSGIQSGGFRKSLAEVRAKTANGPEEEGHGKIARYDHEVECEEGSGVKYEAALQTLGQKDFDMDLSLGRVKSP
jgi:hypothetical protein